MKDFDLNLIINLQKALRTDFLDKLFYAISFIGSEYFFLGVAAVLFWCVNKKFGYKFTNIFFMGQVAVGVIKSVVARPRPYQRGAAAVISKTSGYSFPSGHAHGAANMATQLSIARKKSKYFVKFAVLSAIITVLVMFSRMYLGQHYLTDVICGAALGILIAFVLTAVFKLLGDKEEWLVVVILPLTVILAAIAIAVSKNPADSVKIFGVYGALTLGYFLEKHKVCYDVRSGSCFKQIAKVLLGLAVLILIKEGIGFLADAAKIAGRTRAVTDYLRYFLIGISATLLLPMLFKKLKI